MPGEDVYSWSTTASANGSADTLINWAEGQPRASVNNSARSMMAALAKQFALFNGSIVTTGTANAQSFTSGIGYTVVPNQFYARIKIGAGLTNTGAMTLQMDGLGAKTVLTAAATALTGGEFSSGGYTEVLYNGSNWVFLQLGRLCCGRRWRWWWWWRRALVRHTHHSAGNFHIHTGSHHDGHHGGVRRRRRRWWRHFRPHQHRRRPILFGRQRRR